MWGSRFFDLTEPFAGGRDVPLASPCFVPVWGMCAMRPTCYPTAVSTVLSGPFDGRLFIRIVLRSPARFQWDAASPAGSGWSAASQRRCNGAGSTLGRWVHRLQFSPRAADCSASGGEVIAFDGFWLGNGSLPTRVWLGPVESPSQYECLNPRNMNQVGVLGDLLTRPEPAIRRVLFVGAGANAPGVHAAAWRWWQDVPLCSRGLDDGPQLARLRFLRQ